MTYRPDPEDGFDDSEGFWDVPMETFEAEDDVMDYDDDYPDDDDLEDDGFDHYDEY